MCPVVAAVGDTPGGGSLLALGPPGTLIALAVLASPEPQAPHPLGQGEPSLSSPVRLRTPVITEWTLRFYLEP